MFRTVSMTSPPPRSRVSASEMCDPRVRAFHEALAAFPARLFQLDARIGEGWYSDRYFVRTARTIALTGRDPVVSMQIFGKQYGVIAGVYEAIRILETHLATHPETGRTYTLREFTIDALMDGDGLSPYETAMLITGPYVAYAHLETLYLGVLARRSLVASNARRAVDAANEKPVIFMGARHDDWRVQIPDGYAARVGGASSVSSDAGGAWWGAFGVGTMPHAMIAAFGGDVVAATLAFARYCREHEPELKVVSLVDYQNDVIRDALAVAHAMREVYGPGSLDAVRVDTNEGLVDASLTNLVGREGSGGLQGVNPKLVRRLRQALDDAGFPEVGIVVSGGFTAAKIRSFEQEQVPVIGYGVGSSLLGHNNGKEDGLLNSFDFTGDVVLVDGERESKVGRGVSHNPRLIRFDPDLLATIEQERAR